MGDPVHNTLFQTVSAKKYKKKLFEIKVVGKTI